MGLDKTLVGMRYRAPHTYSIQGGGMGFSIRRWESSRKTGVFSIPLPYFNYRIKSGRRFFFTLAAHLKGNFIFHKQWYGLKICFPFPPIEFIHEKERKETDGETVPQRFFQQKNNAIS